MPVKPIYSFTRNFMKNWDVVFKSNLLSGLKNGICEKIFSNFCWLSDTKEKYVSKNLASW